MSRADEGAIAVGRVWARSILELAAEAGREDDVLSELDAISGAISGDRRVEDFFSSPLVDPEARRSAVEAAFRGKASDLVVDALLVMNSKGRMGLVGAVATAYRRELDTRAGRVQATVRSAVPLDEDIRASLTAAASKWAGKNVRLVETVDPTILGGLIVEVGDQKIDSSVASAVATVRRSLLKRTAEELRGGRVEAAYELGE